MSGLNASVLVKPEFSVRIVVCDHYLTKPTPGIDVIYSEFRGSDIKQVPVLRIFGSTPDGRKACLHVHGVFPYFYVPCPTPNPQPQFLYQIAASLDKALNIALKQATSSNQHVYKITMVKGLPFYGFHDKDHLYLKIFLYSPNLIKQAVELCANGAILGQAFQPHESHLNFTLQFFIDFNLFGMSNIDLQAVKFRRSGHSQFSNEPLETEFNMKPESVCYYEADCVASHIINRQRVGKGDGIENPGLEEVWNQGKERRKQLNVSMASKSLSQGRIDSEQTESHYKFDNMCLVKLSGLVDNPIDIQKEVEYPAESLEGTQLFKAVEVSMHLPDTSLYTSVTESLRRSLDETLTEDADNTIVDESLALNCSLSLHYSQIQLDTEDLELVDMLQDMDEKPVEEDSIMATQPEPERDGDIDSDDAEYSHVYSDDTILLEPFQSKDDADESSPSWHDSFWEGANIPQLDGTCDDDHVKKVRKRKMRPFKLGLSKPKSKKNDALEEFKTQSDMKSDLDDVDEINASRDTIDSISDSHLKRSVKKEAHSIVEMENDHSNDSITDFVNKISTKHENTELEIAKKYDIQQNFEPAPGPSRVNIKIDVNKSFNQSWNDSYESTPEHSKGIISFYDTSKMFDMSLNESNLNIDNVNNSLNINEEKALVNNDVNMCIAQESKAISTNLETNTVIREDVNNLGEKTIGFRELPTDTTKLWFDNTTVLTPKIRPPTKSYIESSLQKYNIPKVINTEPYFSDPKDVGDKVELGQILLKLQSKLARDQKPFEKVLDTTSIEEWRQLLFLQTNEMNEESTKPEVLKNLLAGNKRCILEPIKRPPKKSDVIKWIEETQIKTTPVENIKDDTELTKNLDDLDNSQAIGLNEDEINSSISLEVSEKEKSSLNTTLQVTMQPDGSFLCFGNSESQKESPDAPVVEVDYLTIMLIEVLASVRGELHPDPNMDPIQAVFVTITNDCPNNSFLPKHLTEIIVVDAEVPKHLQKCVFKTKITYVDTENDLLEKVIELVKHHDPDIMCGYEIEMNSWGYFLERSQVLGLEVVKEISRITEKYRQKKWRIDDSDFDGKIIGRIVFNVWRLFRYELALSSYSFENCMYEVLKERVPKYTFAQLYEWWRHESRMLRWLPVEYYLTRLSGTVRMLEKLDIINRTSELARLFGLQWWEVLSRGSQFRVESLMLRAARPLNLVALSPTVRQRAAMKAPECLPLIFEPESRFYTDPVIVLDFQSLYPSMMIAYNYCFSTCIGRVQNVNGDAPYEFGAWRLRIPKSKLDTLVKSGLVNWSPVGVGFVKPSVRRGVLPALLRRILAARQAVKKGMKLQTDEGVKKAMHSRQLGLKLIANVTYGYTAANFSGRMPCVEVGDSVVAKGRETLERAIKLVRNNTQWNAKVVYGDTDSMFVVVPGGTKEEAFQIGQQIADAVTADNPSPVALKLEKVYQPCILQTKKRYVGYMYESADQEKPVYEAKGIETVRRDGCPAGVKLLHRSLCELFDHADMSIVKRHVVSTLCRLKDGGIPTRDLLFTREYHGVAGYKAGASAPPNEIAKRISSRDRRAVPRTGERVSWLVCAGPPQAPLIKLARTPEELLKEPGPTQHVAYYATRVLLPPLHRCLSLLGANVFKWWTDLGYNRDVHQRTLVGGIARYMRWRRCAVCGARGTHALCHTCVGGGGEQRAGTALAVRRRTAEECLAACDVICKSCTGHSNAWIRCENAECPVLWRRVVARQKLDEVTNIFSQLPVHNEELLHF